MKQQRVIFLCALACASIAQRTCAHPPQETIIQKVVRKYKESPALTGVTVGGIATLATLVIHHEVIANNPYQSMIGVPAFVLSSGATAGIIQKDISQGWPTTEVVKRTAFPIACNLIWFLGLYYQAYLDASQ